jgi:hypothetical protein
MWRIKHFSVFVLFLLLNTNFAYSQPANGDIVKIKNVSANKFAAPRDASTENNAGIVISDNSTGAQFRWQVSRVYTRGTSPAYLRYAFRNVLSGMYLGVLDGSRDQGAGICQKQFSGGRLTSQPDILWKLETTPAGYKLISNISNQKMAVEGGSTANNAPLIQWSDVGQADLNWQFQPAGSDTSTSPGWKVLFDVKLRYIAVSEATRNRIDNGDCLRIFGQIKVELWELDERNEMKTRLTSYNNMPEILFNQPNYASPSVNGIDYYRSNLANPANDNWGGEMAKVTYNIPQTLLGRRKIMLVVKTNLGTRHKDNDLASYDAIRMQEEVTNRYIINSSSSQTIQSTAAANNTPHRNMVFGDVSIPNGVFGGDDAHRLWVKISFMQN